MERNMHCTSCGTGNRYQGLRNERTLLKPVPAEISGNACVPNPVRPVWEVPDSESPEIEVIKIEDDDDDEDDEIQEISSSYGSGSMNRVSDINDLHKKRILSINSPRRDLLPDPFKYSALYRVKIFQCAVFDHTYCNSNKIHFVPTTGTKKKTDTRVYSGIATTLAFQNDLQCDKNGDEQQTIGGTELITKHFDPATSSSNNGTVLKRRSFNTRIENNVLGTSSSICDNWKARSQISQSASTQGEPSCGKLGYIKIGREGFPSKTSPPSAAQKESNVEINIHERSDTQKSVPNSTEKSLTQLKPLSLDEIAKEISEMEKLLKLKCGNLHRKRNGNDGNGLKGTDVVPSKIRKLSDIEEISESEEDCDYLLSVEKLKNATPEKKDWNLEYLEDDVNELGIDDLLLRASELNAENFTKALGQNSGGRNITKGDGSDIVLTFPESRRNSDEAQVGENSKGANAKKTKIEFLKKCFTDSRIPKPADEGPEMKVPEAPPKRTGIKVKTVQNINEEFDDSLGAKLKGFDVRNTVPDVSKPIYTVPDEPPKKSPAKDKKRKTMSPPKTLVTCRKVIRIPDQGTDTEEDGEESRPFAVTAVQNKNNSVKDHVQSVSAAKAFKTKPIPTEIGRGISLGERVGEVSPNKKSDVGNARKSTENLKLVVSEPTSSKGVEVVNLDECIPDASTTSNSRFVVNYGSYLKNKDVEKNNLTSVNPPKPVPVPLNSAKKCVSVRQTSNNKMIITHYDESKKVFKCFPCPPGRLNVFPAEKPVNPQVERPALPEKPASAAKSAEPKTKPTNTPGVGIKQLIRLPSIDTCPKYSKPVEVISIEEEPRREAENEKDTADKETQTQEKEIQKDTQPKEPVMSLQAFSNILKDILPEKWVLSMDKKYGLQIIRVHLDELLNPSIMVSVVIGSSGKITVNVRGRQLEKTHNLFNNLCDVANQNDKISINYILSIINRLRFFNVCFGCDDLSLKKYWSEEGFIEHYTEFQQTYRSHVCEALVRSGKKRCYPCFRMFESLKKRKRKDELARKTEPNSSSKSTDSGKNVNESPALSNNNNNTNNTNNTDNTNINNNTNTNNNKKKNNNNICSTSSSSSSSGNTSNNTSNKNNNNNNSTSNSQGKGARRNLEEFLEESFSNMKKKIADDIERTREDEEMERIPKTQDEVLGFMGLTRKDSLDTNLRKSKREKKNCKNGESLMNSGINKEELYFIEKYWPEINVLFSTSLLIGAYSRTGTVRLREKCRMLHKLLSTWRSIIRDNPDWIGGHIHLTEGFICDDELMNFELMVERFEKMDIPALRAYIIVCVKEINKIKNKLRTKNSYFKALYNTFVKPKMKKTKQNAEASGEPSGEPSEEPCEEAFEEAFEEPIAGPSTSSAYGVPLDLSVSRGREPGTSGSMDWFTRYIASPEPGCSYGWRSND